MSSSDGWRICDSWCVSESGTLHTAPSSGAAWAVSGTRRKRTDRQTSEGHPVGDSVHPLVSPGVNPRPVAVTGVVLVSRAVIGGHDHPASLLSVDPQWIGVHETTGVLPAQSGLGRDHGWHITLPNQSIGFTFTVLRLFGARVHGNVPSRCRIRLSSASSLPHPLAAVETAWRAGSETLPGPIAALVSVPVQYIVYEVLEDRAVRLQPVGLSLPFLAAGRTAPPLRQRWPLCLPAARYVVPGASLASRFVLR